ncbi:hypothetical protein AB0M44_38090 [Streptosporangium subroseum]|uniref:hypothetical protein n=1 Tax=Streptosporangium subroseum TaxID=106412 RepID=UPI00342E85F2
METKLSLGGGLASLQLTGQASTKAFSEERVLEHVMEALRQRDQLTINRPDRIADLWDDAYAHCFVWESNRLATPVRLPVHEDLKLEYDCDYLTVWVIDPLEEAGRSSERWEIVGTFVFLIQEHWDMSGTPGLIMSGVSALRAIVDVFAGQHPHYRPKSFSEVDRGIPDIYGDTNAKHPLDKLQGVGGHIGLPRVIEVAYQVKYMTNEQKSVINDRAVRLNDILGIPLYIA